MGRKANPIILRIDKTYVSKAKYIEKKSLESPLYNFKNIEIENFIKHQQIFRSWLTDQAEELQTSYLFQKIQLK